MSQPLNQLEGARGTRAVESKRKEIEESESEKRRLTRVLVDVNAREQEHRVEGGAGVADVAEVGAAAERDVVRDVVRLGAVAVARVEAAHGGRLEEARERRRRAHVEVDVLAVDRVRAP